MTKGVFLIPKKMPERASGLKVVNGIYKDINFLLREGVIITPPNGKVQPEIITGPLKQLTQSLPCLIEGGSKENLQETVAALCSLDVLGCEILLPENVSICGPEGQTVSHLDQKGGKNYSKWESGQLEASGWVFRNGEIEIEIPNQA